jgi:VWFA-related protein
VLRRLAAVSIALLALPLHAQSPGASARIDVTLVEVPVNVVDRNGEAVRNLKLENFELLDNGQRRPITHFEAVDLSAAAKKSETSSALQEAAASRNFLILFDLNSATPATLTRAREAARNFIKNPGLGGDTIAVGTFSAESGFNLLTSFTTDMKLVTAAIDTLGTPKMFQPADPLLLSSIELREAADAAESRGNANAAAYAEILRATARTVDRAANDVQRQFISRTLDGYSDIAHLLNRVPGRKQVILLSEGFDAKMIHGRESLSSSAAKEEQTLIERGEYGSVDNDNRFGNASAASDLQAMTAVFRRSDVVLHAIDIKGVRGSTDVSGNAGEKSNESLFLLTHDTGGMVFKNANSLDEDFSRLLKSEEMVYVLGFEASSSAPGKFHDLKVKLVNVPSARAFSRAGYFESAPSTNAIERTLTASEIVMHELPATDIGVRTLATPFPRRDGKAQVPVIVEIDGATILRAAKNNLIQSEVLIYAFDDQNVIRDFVHQPIGLDTVKLKDRLQRGIRVYETLMLPPGHYSIRTLVRAGSPTMHGYAGTTIDIPAFDRTAVLGSAAIDEKPGEWVPVKPPDRAGVPREYPYAVGTTMLVPWAAPVMRPGVATKLGLYLGHVPSATTNVIASIDGRETPVKISSRSTGPEGDEKLLLDFVPPALTPGAHQLTLRVPDAGNAVVSFVVR